jgi:hypothetical protein
LLREPSLLVNLAWGERKAPTGVYVEAEYSAQLGDVQQLRCPIPEEVGPQHDSAVTKPLESSAQKRRPRHRCESRPSAAQQPTSAAGSGRGRNAWGFFERGNGGISRFAFTQFDLTQKSQPKVPPAPSKRIFCGCVNAGGIICDESTLSQPTSAGRTKCRMRCNREPSCIRPSQ